MNNYAKKPIPKIYKTIGWKKLKVKTIDEPLVVINDQILTDPSYDKRYKKSCPQFLLRESAAEKLTQVNCLLKKQYKVQLIIYDALVPPMLQKEVFTNTYKRMLAKYNDPQIARAKTLEFTSEPNFGAPHNSGGAVDLSLADINGKLLFMGTEFDAITEKARPDYYENAKNKQEKSYRDRRRILYWAMTNSGFEIFYSHWWHFSYLDRLWLAIQKQKNPGFDSPIYGPVIKQSIKV